MRKVLRLSEIIIRVLVSCVLFFILCICYDIHYNIKITNHTVNYPFFYQASHPTEKENIQMMPNYLHNRRNLAVLIVRAVLLLNQRVRVLLQNKSLQKITQELLIRTSIIHQ